MNTFKIIRFHRDSHKKWIVKQGLTLLEAHDHCRREDTHGEIDSTGTRPWFDGMQKEGLK